MSRSPILAALALCVVIATAAGCGGSDGPGSTQVTADTAPRPAQPAPSLDPGESERPERTRPRRPVRDAKQAAGPERPPIVKRPIDMGATRREQMAEYSQRHYGEASWRLEPQAIVQHYTAGDSFESAYAMFAQNTPDVELQELPGVCSHYVVDKDGTIYQLVRTTVRCRHTVGLNWAAIGIEHVGTSDAAVMGTTAQLDSSLRLTRWLRCAYGIKVRDVIGHNESLSSPLHDEKVGRLRTQTHGDMQRGAMATYRAKLAGEGC